ncbi:hypothetical protein [Flagellimonas myxillae]|uniref:hypothetical protein n=1 Tax=Flagellimonas myxillae TaxID=2942214 RepID=UPI00201F1C5B|nr:hypothetical protein [Muricauda myxillae]MCL6268244.1 hypothetical protein [Muricauda myxillae]
MDAEKTTQQKIDRILEAASSIETVKTPPFFKDKVLNQLAREPEAQSESAMPGWFGFRYQVAILILFAILNFTVLFLYNSSNEEEELQSLAESYHLSASESNSILN